jgi:hypothetical protein
VGSVEVLLAALGRSAAKLVFVSCPLVRWWIGHSTHDSPAHDGRGAARWRSCAAVEPSGRLGDKPTAPEFAKLLIHCSQHASFMLFDEGATRVPDLADDDDPLIAPRTSGAASLPAGRGERQCQR